MFVLMDEKLTTEELFPIGSYINIVDLDCTCARYYVVTGYTKNKKGIQILVLDNYYTFKDKNWNTIYPGFVSISKSLTRKYKLKDLLD